MQLKMRLLVPLLLATATAAGYSATEVWQTGWSAAWTGALLACAALPAFLLSFVLSGGTARTAPRLPFVQIVAIFGLLLAMYGAIRERDFIALSGLLPFLVALLGVIILEWYVFVFSRYGRKKSSSIVVGLALPELVLETLEGAQVKSREFEGSNTLMVFFRGNWCPLCMAQLRELRSRADRLAASCVQVKLISNQSVERSRELARKLELPDHFQILHDRGLRAAKALSIEDIGGAPGGMRGYPADTVMATVIALDVGGLVMFGDETDNYRVRPHPDQFIPCFEEQDAIGSEHCS